MQIRADISSFWSPIPGTSQKFALRCNAQHVFFTGARGPGKTDTQLMRFRERVGIGYGEFWRGVIFDREYKNLDDLIAKSKRWFNRANDGCQFLSSASALKWKWPTGEELLFRVAANEDDYWDYHGQEFPFIGWNELTKYPTGDLYEMMNSTNRSSFVPEDYPIYLDEKAFLSGKVVHLPKGSRGGFWFKLEPIPLEVFSTGNPYGAGHAWVKKRFIDPAPYGKIVSTTSKVFDPRSKKEVEVTKRQISIFGSYSENIYLDAQYVATLDAEKDPNRRKAWLTGDWDIVSGGAFDDVWNKAVHVLPRFQVPESWRINRSFDWGSTHPFSVGWWAESDGTEAEIILNGEAYSFCPPKGTLIRIAEWYGVQLDKNGVPDIGSNKGLKLTATQIAEGILQREEALLFHEWIKSKPWPGPADNQIRDVRESDVETIELKMSKSGVRWLESDKSPGSRKNGMDLLRERLYDSIYNQERPGIYFMDNCRAAISILPILPRDADKPDDVDFAEDHVYDEIRYRVLQGNRKYATKIKVSLPS